jgi:drug/metabolite transporter (DMT)-like permease
MAAALALVAAVCFALAATLQQLGQFRLAQKGTPVEGVAGLLRMLTVPIWLFGTVVLLCGYASQGAALDRGKLVVVQPLMVTTVVWALPLGHWLTNQTIVRRQILGALVVVVGLSLFVLVGDPSSGNSTAATSSLLIASAAVTVVVVGLLIWLRKSTKPTLRAAVLGVCAGLFFGLSTIFAKPVINDLHVSLATAATDWQTWALLGFGFIAFVIQQLSLATGQLAPAMAAVSVANPAISVFLGIVLFNEALTRPPWHVLVALTAFLAALIGATLITMSSQETQVPGSSN